MLNEDQIVVKAESNTINADDTDIVKRIKELLENYVKPAVEMDGGAISFKGYDAGVVKLMMQGSCSGCPSSMITLKAGIEGMMKRMIPEVKEVVAEAEEGIVLVINNKIPGLWFGDLCLYTICPYATLLLNSH